MLLSDALGALKAIRKGGRKWPALAVSREAIRFRGPGQADSVGQAGGGVRGTYV